MSLTHHRGRLTHPRGRLTHHRGRTKSSYSAGARPLARIEATATQASLGSARPGTYAHPASDLVLHNIQLNTLITTIHK